MLPSRILLATLQRLSLAVVVFSLTTGLKGTNTPEQTWIIDSWNTGGGIVDRFVLMLPIEELSALIIDVGDKMLKLECSTAQVHFKVSFVYGNDIAFENPPVRYAIGNGSVKETRDFKSWNNSLYTTDPDLFFKWASLVASSKEIWFEAPVEDAPPASIRFNLRGLSDVIELFSQRCKKTLKR